MHPEVMNMVISSSIVVRMVFSVSFVQTEAIRVPNLQMLGFINFVCWVVQRCTRERTFFAQGRANAERMSP
jgi:hypothetical protein